MKNQKLKHGVLASAITAGVIVAVILLNVLATVLMAGGLNFIDFTKENFLTISEESRTMLDTLDPDENDITIYFLADPDELDNASISGNSSGSDTSTWGMKYVYEMANLYAREYSFIRVDTLDLKKDAELIRTRYASTSGSELDALDVIIDNCPDGVTHNYRICSRDAFFTFDSSSSTVYAANGDLRYTSTILSLSGTYPTVYFVTGHGEKVGDPDNDEDYGEASAIAALFREAGFSTVKIDLMKEDFRDDNENSLVNGSSVVCIYGPESDYIAEIGSDSVNEITKIRKFVNAKNHHLMVFLDPSEGSLSNLEEYLYDFWGVTFNRNTVVADTTDAATSPAVSDDGKAFIAEYETSDTSVGVSLTASLIDNLDSIPEVYFKNARTLTVKSDYADPYGYWDAERNASIYAGSVFNAPALSAAEFEDGSVETYSEKVYGLYYDRIYEEKYSEIRTYYLSRYDDIYSAVSDSYRDELYTNEYERLYNLKTTALYDAYVSGHTGEENLEYNAYLYALEEVEAFIPSYEEEAKSYVETAMASKTEEIRKRTDDTLEALAEKYMDSYLSETEGACLAALTYENWSYELSNERIPTYVLTCGSTSFASEEALSSGVYGNRDALYSAMRLMGKEIIPFDIDFVRVESEALDTEDVNTTGFTVLVTVLPALIVLSAGTAVLILRRKHR